MYNIIDDYYMEVAGAVDKLRSYQKSIGLEGKHKFDVETCENINACLMGLSEVIEDFSQVLYNSGVMSIRL